ncbi:MAG: 50S ribosomal protein L32, partial [Cyclobacteriaceae bacterium]
AKQLAVCPTTGELHLPHRAFWHEGKLYYKGKVVMEKEVLA